jgi:hypothetical protein
MTGASALGTAIAIGPTQPVQMLLAGIFVVEIVFELHEADDFLLSHVYRPPLNSNLHLDNIKHKFFIQWFTE